MFTGIIQSIGFIHKINIKENIYQIKTKLDRNILNMLEKGDFILGEKVFDLEKKMAEYVGVNECITCASGTDALQISLMANNIGPGDAVFTTNFSFFATTEVISLVGATPVFVDVEEMSFNIDYKLLENKILTVINEGKYNPKAIIAVDLFGQLANYDRIEKIAKKYNLLLIEDAAQSFGASFNGKKAGSFGDLAATSFYPAKPLGCYGDGGAIFTNNIKLAKKIRSIRVHGEGKDKYDNIRIGLNSRLDTIQAIVLLEKMTIFDTEIKSRNNIAKYYTKHLSEYVKTPNIIEGNISSWAQYSILVNKHDRSKLIKHLMKENIPTAVFYKIPFNMLKLYNNSNKSSYKISLKLSKRILSIPMHPYLTKTEQNLIIKTIQKFLK